MRSYTCVGCLTPFGSRTARDEHEDICDAAVALPSSATGPWPAATGDGSGAAETEVRSGEPAAPTSENPAARQFAPDALPETSDGVEPSQEKSMPPTDPDCVVRANGLNPEHVCCDEFATLREGERCWAARAGVRAAS